MKELIRMFYPDVDRGTFHVENLNTLPASAFFSCASTATGALALATVDVAGGATSIASDKITSTKRTLATA